MLEMSLISAFPVAVLKLLGKKMLGAKVPRDAFC